MSNTTTAAPKKATFPWMSLAAFGYDIYIECSEPAGMRRSASVSRQTGATKYEAYFCNGAATQTQQLFDTMLDAQLYVENLIKTEPIK